MALCFVYKWTHLPTLMWYVGSRTAKGCYPTDGYICSSKTVKELIEEDATQWKREVIAIGEAVDMIKLEAEILQLADAKHDPRSFNRHNGDGKFTSTGKIVSKSTKEIMSKNRKGVSKSQEHKDAIKAALINGFKNGKIARPKRIGSAAPGFKGYYVSPTGKEYTASEASKEFNVTPEAIRKWGKLKKNGWSFKNGFGE